MILSKKQICELKKGLKKAKLAEIKLSMATQSISMLISKFTGIEGECDLLTGDGFGFMPRSGDYVHIPVVDLIKHAEKGQDITEDFVLQNLSI